MKCVGSGKNGKMSAVGKVEMWGERGAIIRGR